MQTIFPLVMAETQPAVPSSGGTVVALVLLALGAYLIGSIPFGFLVARAKGVDIRTVGSRNIGATNVFRTLGKGPGILTFVLDVLKGYLPAALLPCLVLHLVPDLGWSEANLRLLGGLMAVVGHTRSVFLGFKGGKGVATSAGMLIGIAPGAVGIAFASWVVAFLVTRYVSVASILAAAVLGVLMWLSPFFVNLPTAVLLTLLALSVILRHHANIKRLLQGTESRFAFTKAQREAQRSASGKGKARS